MDMAHSKLGIAAPRASSAVRVLSPETRKSSPSPARSRADAAGGAAAAATSARVDTRRSWTDMPKGFSCRNRATFARVASGKSARGIVAARRNRGSDTVDECQPRAESLDGGKRHEIGARADHEHAPLAGGDWKNLVM